MNIFGIGLPEMAVIAAIALLVFGPKRLPEFGKTLGRTLRGFQSASQEFEQEFRSALSETTAASPAASASAPADLTGPAPGSFGSSPLPSADSPAGSVVESIGPVVPGGENAYQADNDSVASASGPVS